MMHVATIVLHHATQLPYLSEVIKSYWFGS